MLTRQLILRRPQPGDAARVFAIYGDPATHRFNPAGPLQTEAEAQTLLRHWLQHWASKGFGHWAVATIEAPERIIGFGGIDTRLYLHTERLNLGYRFAADVWGRGFATELGRVALQYAFHTLAVAEVFAVVRPKHEASIRVLEKLGMAPAGTLDDFPGLAPSLVYKAEKG